MVKSHRGKNVDMERIALENQKAIAIGNVKYNARGDILGKGGKIEKTREEIVKEYYEANPPTETQMSLVSNNKPVEVVETRKQETTNTEVKVQSQKPTSKKKTETNKE